jgi:hypothetical protein
MEKMMSDKTLLQVFIDSGLPVGQVDTFKAGAAYGYLLAKRQMVEAIDNRLDSHGACIEPDQPIVAELQGIRNYVRNVMLFKRE